MAIPTVYIIMPIYSIYVEKSFKSQVYCYLRVLHIINIFLLETHTYIKGIRRED